MRKNLRKREKNKDNKNFVKILAILLLLALISFLGYHLFLGIEIASEKFKILEVAEKDVGDLRIQNLKLVLEKSEIVSLDYIEKEARDRLRYSKEDETLFVIPDELLNAKWVEEELNMIKGSKEFKDEKKPKEILQIWIDFLFLKRV